jgi:ABC-2 type transport system ATP-binding protein
LIIEFDEVSRSFGAEKAVDKLTLAVQAGDFFGLLGRNGSGKSTLIAMLLGLFAPDAGGTIRLFGETVNRSSIIGLRGRVGVVGEAPQLRDDRTAWEYLDFFARLYGLAGRREKVRARMEQVGLANAGSKRIRTFSRGMKQRLSLARALLHDPELLVLDEPINGLDPQGIREVRELLQRENRNGRTVFLCSHLLSEVEKSCNRVAVIHRGRLRACGPLAELAAGDLERRFFSLTAEDGGQA